MNKAGIDNYSLFPLDLSPMALLQWAEDHGAGGVAFSGLEPRHRALCDISYLLDLKDMAADLNLYLEWGGAQHIPRDLSTWQKKEIAGINEMAAKEAMTLNTRIVRSCSGGLMRWNPESIPTRDLVTEMSDQLLTQREMLRDHGIILAIETHFEFTTHELVRVLEACQAEPGDWLGICLDTMNLLTLLEDPVWATERVLPWVVSTHIKDGGIVQTDQGFRSFPCALGTGVVDIGRILTLISNQSKEINFSIENHGGWFDIPLNDPRFRKELPDLNDEELGKMIHLSIQTKKKRMEGRCTMTDRNEWPKICEGRVIDDLESLRKMINMVAEEE